MPIDAKCYNIPPTLASIEGEEQQIGQNDWLGLDDAQAPRAGKSASESNELNSSRTESDDKKVLGSRAGQVSQDDWLGLSDENIHETLQTAPQRPNELVPDQIKGWKSQRFPAIHCHYTKKIEPYVYSVVCYMLGTIFCLFIFQYIDL